MDSDYQEIESWSISGIHYRSTRATANTIAVAMSNHPKVRRFHIIRKMLESFVVRTIGIEFGKLEELATELVDLDVEIEQIALQTIIDCGGST